MTGRTARIVRQINRRLAAAAYGSPFYRKILGRGRAPANFGFALPDRWPGDAKAGQLLIGRRELFDSAVATTLTGNWRGFPAAEHGWLRDLRAVGNAAARERARVLLTEWLDGSGENWHETAWSPAVMGERIANWISFRDFYAPDNKGDAALMARLAASAMRQTRHLLHVLPSAFTGRDNVAAVRGLIYSCLAMPDSDGRRLGFSLDLLRRQAMAEVLSDGGHISRDPVRHLRALRWMIDIREALTTSRIAVPDELSSAIIRMAPALRVLRHGDGRLALFNGGSEGNGENNEVSECGNVGIEAVLNAAGAKRRALRRLEITGYERITAGRSLLLVDTGEPPPAPYDDTAHAGFLSFEFSYGRERVIVNCGAMVTDGRSGCDNARVMDPWRAAMSATAAHSTVTVADTNACEIKQDGGLGTSAITVMGQRYEQNRAACLDAWHDGYLARLGIHHHRRFILSADGEELSGYDTLSGTGGMPFTLRWHIHPTVQVSAAGEGQSVLLRTPSGIGWRLRAEGALLSIESSVYCGGLNPRRSVHIRTDCRTQSEPTMVSWVLRREKA